MSRIKWMTFVIWVAMMFVAIDEIRPIVFGSDLTVSSYEESNDMMRFNVLAGVLTLIVSFALASFVEVLAGLKSNTKHHVVMSYDFDYGFGCQSCGAIHDVDWANDDICINCWKKLASKKSERGSVTFVVTALFAVSSFVGLFVLPWLGGMMQVVGGLK